MSEFISDLIVTAIAVAVIVLNLYQVITYLIKNHRKVGWVRKVLCIACSLAMCFLMVRGWLRIVLDIV